MAAHAAVAAEPMRRALELAMHGWGRVHPNPLVGAVVVRDGRVVGEGWHAEYGGAHAEIAALESAGAAAEGATLHVTLEPCAHHGKTPPCTEAIVRAGVRRVVFGAADPNPSAAGGAAVLRAAGIEVVGGIEADGGPSAEPDLLPPSRTSAHLCRTQARRHARRQARRARRAHAADRRRGRRENPAAAGRF
jgi:riboflavin biosynthesis protein RibD